jgi:TonB-dependent SusC/RagA subfamily outer membrane receptor
MSRTYRISTVLVGAALLVSVGCGSPGLPPAGPEPGNVDVGYGTQPEEKVTGAVSSVSTDELGATRAANIEELLRGRVAGLEILKEGGGGLRFRIRGIGTINETPEPLFVIDGTPVSADNIESILAGMTRDDIRQVDVLKDVASTSIYGQRGVGGVIIITTRR